MGGASGSTIDLGPEDLSGELEFATTNFKVGETGTPSQAGGYIVWWVASLDVEIYYVPGRLVTAENDLNGTLDLS